MEGDEEIGMSSSMILMSDIHSNLEALKAVSEDMPHLPICCIGDFVGYGADPSEVVQWAREREVMAVMGNHDYATVTGDTKWFNSEAAAAIEWTRRQIGSAEKKYLSSLSRRRELNVGGFSILLAHGSPTDPLFEYVHPATHEYLFTAYLKRFKVDIIVMGHTHIPFIWEGGKGYIVNPGSVGQPRTGNPNASYLILKVEGGRVEFEHRAVPYDAEAAAEKIRSAGLPAFLAERLSRGV